MSDYDKAKELGLTDKDRWKGEMMSYWVYLEDAETKKPANIQIPHTEGGTFQMGGCFEAELNVTYNYSKIWSVSKLQGMTGKDSIPILENGVAEYGIKKDPDYWNPTRGNVGHMMNILLEWAKQYPDFIWKVN